MLEMLHISNKNVFNTYAVNIAIINKIVRAVFIKIVKNLKVLEEKSPLTWPT